MSQVDAAVAALVIVFWMAVLMAIAYRAGKESKACCFRHGRDAPMIPPPILPGMYIKVEGKPPSHNANVVYVSRAAKGGDLNE